MALNATVLGNLIKTEMLAADPSVTKPEMVDSFAQAIARAIVTHLTTSGSVIIPAGVIVTNGSASTQTGPAAPVPLTIT